MPRRIHILPDSLVNQIAAGEVVERPASVVKELVENALDARATRVEVSLQNGGKTEIRVADDGLGMGREDALLSLDRHATSKIARPEDLASVTTFGFRGEALPSIAAVSRLVLETAEPGGVGTRIRVVGGRIQSVEECARQPGTTVVVRNLFFNVPARAKFLRSASTETRAATEALTNLALSNLSVAFRLESNGRVLMDLPPAPDLASRVAELWGDDVAARLVAVQAQRDGITVAGLVDRPDATLTGPRRVHFFVGGRPFRDRGLALVAERAYATTIPHGARPSLLLYIDVPPGGVDVNVHPTKAEVRFRDRLAVEAAVEAAVRAALASLDSAATLDARPPLPQLRTPRPVHTARGPSSAPSRAGAGRPGRQDAWQLAFFVPAPVAAANETVEEPGDNRDDAQAAAAPEPGMRPRPSLWQVHDTYILAETRSGLLIIDQHSAHERVLFEETMRRLTDGGAVGQRLLFPITLRLSPAEQAIIDDIQPFLARAGFEIEAFGGRTIIVHAVPQPHPHFDPERCLREMLAELATGSELTRAARNQHERIAMTFACKAAIKAGQPLSEAEMHELFDRLFATELPSHDVHGRPTIVRLSLQELERRFGRHG
ncbi:MAG: DNA mismatch repair endonuclease MutL [bacterium]|jgi:DNA mismatch repair protein MutL|nr:MAG: DNA mismatch repair endonuclease MutL [bacterium]